MDRALLRSLVLRQGAHARPHLLQGVRFQPTVPQSCHAFKRPYLPQRIPWPTIRTYATNPPTTTSDPKHISDQVTESSYAQPASELSQTITPEERSHYAELESHSKTAQLRSPWTRASSDVPPVHASRNASAMTKGKLLTTPSRMLKLIIPLAPVDMNDTKKDVEPLALFVHPQQPLSYLERLIQSELPFIKDGSKERVPNVTFRAEDPEAHERAPDKRMGDLSGEDSASKDKDEGGRDEDEFMMIDGKLERTGKLNGKKQPRQEGEGREDLLNPELEGRKFIRWSPSTEIGDFIRDASAGNLFLISIEKYPHPIPVAVPTFNERTYYLRMRLRKVSGKIEGMAGVKADCDRIARQGAKRVAQLGFCGLVGWWYLVYRLTFETELGWDVMEPVTYLVGLSTLIGGYLWFLYHNREVSYKSAFHVTVSKRQAALYEKHGFDQSLWDGLIEEGNRLRREIKMVAEEYDVEWDEKKEAGEEVEEALRKERKKQKNSSKRRNRDDEDDD
ncbi:hypothetical protein KVT40_008077 [Elsinoe batatas]|uniref:Calcium uniporter protein, mitochondrial n=1 Tax=Elsinoe batatas TaxID=2601811 RepID=A0A8K0PB72_9PEZI|nr:hypothetical protein KVT40_008077 [Elsinoe batatas]